MYDEAQERTLPEARVDLQQYAEHDVLMYDEDGFVSETSRCTPYFWRDGTWVTPAVSNADAKAKDMLGGQRGSTRRWALKNKFCREGKIAKDDLDVGEIVWVSNGVRGFNLAVLGKGGGSSTDD
jgi:4-amino-4-deoxychorismate lyase